MNAYYRRIMLMSSDRIVHSMLALDGIACSREGIMEMMETDRRTEGFTDEDIAIVSASWRALDLMMTERIPFSIDYLTTLHDLLCLDVGDSSRILMDTGSRWDRVRLMKSSLADALEGVAENASLLHRREAAGYAAAASLLVTSAILPFRERSCSIPLLVSLRFQAEHETGMLLYPSPKAGLVEESFKSFLQDENKGIAMLLEAMEELPMRFPAKGKTR